MALFRRCTIINIILFVSFLSSAFGQNVITGAIKDESNLPLIGAVLNIKGSTENTVTNSEGKFSLTTSQGFPLTILVNYLGFSTKEITLTKAQDITITMSEGGIELKEANIRSTRITEKQKESPLTIEALDMVGIRETPSVNFYEALGQLKGVDLTSASLGFKVINTRGFNSTSPVRSLQIIDGIDNQSPGLNFSLGNFLGASELDIQKVELIIGASSAYYGPNAFNGVISMTTRSPFLKPGLEINIKAGERNLFEGAARWAQVFKDKKQKERFGYKLNLFFMRANDWEANNLAATPQSKSNETNPGGYDAVNVYGDEYILGSDYSKETNTVPGLGIFYRRGYAEKDLVDYQTWNVKVNGAAHYKIKDNLELILGSNYCTGTTVYQGDNRYRLKDIQFFQHKVEIKAANWFLRGYITHEDAGNSYDAYFTALRLQSEGKTESFFKKEYEKYWIDNYGGQNIQSLNPQDTFLVPPTDPGQYQIWRNEINSYLNSQYYDSMVAWHRAAQDYGNAPNSILKSYGYFKPGTYEFDTAFAGITSRKVTEGGTRFFDKSALYHLHGEYRFTPVFAEIILGGNYRMYTPNSEGTIFSDTNGVKIRNQEFGLYAGIEKKYFDEKLKVNMTARMDKNENFPYLFSPAISFVYKPVKDQFIRLSFSSAIRNPTLADQYLFYNVGRAILIGNLNGYNGLVTIPSLIKTFDVGKIFDSLSFFNVKPVRPEEVKTIELGYRGSIGSHLYIDAGAYYSWYKYFIGYKIGVDVDTFHSFLGTPEILVNNAFRVASNSEDIVNTYGIALGLNYYFGKHFAFTSNYSWNKLDRKGSDDPLIPAYNTPEHKVNLGINGRDMANFGFNINYKYVEGFLFEGSPQFTGYINSYNLVDVQINRKFPKLKSTFKAGASNVLDNKHYEVYGGPLIGRLVYLSIITELN
jgi:iron complex outermembrane recepter protein